MSEPALRGAAAVHAALVRPRQRGRLAFVAYLTAGFPSLDSTVPLLLEMELSGVDLIELGIPYSAPLADGPDLRAAMATAVENGGGVHSALRAVREARAAGLKAPVVLMSYANPVFAWGDTGQFCRACAEAGVDGFLLPDMGYEMLLDGPIVGRVGKKCQGVDWKARIDCDARRAAAAGYILDRKGGENEMRGAVLEERIGSGLKIGSGDGDGSVFASAGGGEGAVGGGGAGGKTGTGSAGTGSGFAGAAARFRLGLIPLVCSGAAFAASPFRERILASAAALYFAASARGSGGCEVAEWAARAAAELPRQCRAVADAAGNAGAPAGGGGDEVPAENDVAAVGTAAAVAAAAAGAAAAAAGSAATDNAAADSVAFAGGLPPAMVGFGISTRAHVAALYEILADVSPPLVAGFVVGTRLVSALREPGNARGAFRECLRGFARARDSGQVGVSRAAAPGAGRVGTVFPLAPDTIFFRTAVDDVAPSSPSAPGPPLPGSAAAAGWFACAFGGRYVPHAFEQQLAALALAFERATHDAAFLAQLAALRRDFAGRPTPLMRADRFAAACNQDRLVVYLKREDLAFTGSHKINNALGQALLAKTVLRKSRVICETGAGQHGVAVAAACARLGLRCQVFMGRLDARRQRANVGRMRMLGADVERVGGAAGTLADAVVAALQAAAAAPDAHLLVGSVVGPDPYPRVVRFFQSVIGEEVGAQIELPPAPAPEAAPTAAPEAALEGSPEVAATAATAARAATSAAPAALAAAAPALAAASPHPSASLILIACVGGGSNALGLFAPFLAHRPPPRMIAVEAAGAAAGTDGVPGVLHGTRTLVLQDQQGNTRPTKSISAGLTYPAIGPELAALAAEGRVAFVAADDAAALEGAATLARTEGILCALESAHAVGWLLQNARTLPSCTTVVLNLSGRGDKDLETYLDRLPERVRP